MLVLAATLGAALAAVAQAAPALAVVSPAVTISCSSPGDCTASGSGFTHGGQVQVQASAGGAVFSTSSLTASQPTTICVIGLKPHCFTYGGGTFTAALPTDYGIQCGDTQAGTVVYTDVSTGEAVSQPVTWVGPCASPTTTALSIPSTVDTGWSATNPANVTAGSVTVTSGTITISVNGVSVCSYTAGASSGCTLANLPAGTDQVQAVYSGSTIPPYDASSTSATVNVLQDQQPYTTVHGPGWAGYAATGETYTSVSASWTVPAVNCSNAVATTSATWVGIDGAGNGTVEQIGTDSNCMLFNGSYWAWWQMYPNAPVIIGAVPANNPVRAGDLMNASVTYAGSPGTYTLSITDESEFWSYSTTQSLAGATGATAECIEEQPAAAGLPLADFGSVTFNQCQVTGNNGIATPIWDHPNIAYDMALSDGTPQVNVSPLSDDGTQFTATWLHG